MERFYKALVLPVLLLFSFVIVSCAGTNIFCSYSAGNEAKAILDSGHNNGVTVEQKKDCIIIYPKNYKAGFIFYPGAKVDYKSYLPLCKAIAEKGFYTILVHMPFDIAILGTNKAKGFIEELPEIEHWYIGGHSLGGAMAGTFASKNADLIDGIVLMAAYSINKIDDSIKVLSLYGSCDKVLNMENYEKYKKNLPDDFTEIVIQGGCHSYFGDYGHQKGDGEPSITREEQLKTTVDAIQSNLL